jgi:WD40 repeat protein
MHAERDHLLRFVFPELRERLHYYGVALDEIDLRWGITEEQVNEGKLLDLCLQHIEESDYFVGIVGQRYGTVVDELPESALKRLESLDSSRKYSVTELEIRYALQLLGKTLQSAFFYFREESGIGLVPDEQLVVYQDTDQKARLRLQELKSLITREATAGVYHYHTAWDANSYEQATQRYGRLGELDKFGEKLLEQLWLSIENGHLAAVALPNSSDGKAWEENLHQLFYENRLRAVSPYVRQEVQSQLREYLSLDTEGSGYRKPLLLTGAPGSGKSTILAQLAKAVDLKELGEWKSVIHFVGASPQSASPQGLLSRLASSISHTTGVELPDTHMRADFADWIQSQLSTWPEAVPLLILIDGLDQLEDQGNPTDILDWIPKWLPSNVRIALSAADSSDSNEGRQGIVAAAENRYFFLVRLLPLGEEECAVIARDVPALAAKSLSKSQLQALLFNPATRNPLFLRVALEELRGFGSYEQLDARIAAFPDPSRKEPPLPALFGQVIDRLELEFDTHLVQKVLGLLVCARTGLTDGELETLTSDGPNKDLFPLLRRMRLYLKGGAEGRGFFHRSFELAVRERYLRKAPKKQAYHASLALFFSAQPDYYERSEKVQPNRRKAEELYRQYEQSEAFDEAAKLLCYPSFLVAKLEVGLLEDLISNFEASIAHHEQTLIKARIPLLEAFPKLYLALLQHTSFLSKYPQCLFQVFWNFLALPDKPYDGQVALGQPYSELRVEDWIRKWSSEPVSSFRPAKWIKQRKPLPRAYRAALRKRADTVFLLWSEDSQHLLLTGFQNEHFVWFANKMDHPFIKLPDPAEGFYATKWSPSRPELMIEIQLRDSEVNVYNVVLLWSAEESEDYAFIFEIDEENVFCHAVEWEQTGTYIIALIKVVKEDYPTHLLVVFDRFGNEEKIIAVEESVPAEVSLPKKRFVFACDRCVAYILKGDSVHLWDWGGDTVDYYLLAELEEEAELLSWSPCGQYLACFWGAGRIMIWDISQLEMPVYEGDTLDCPLIEPYWGGEPKEILYHLKTRMLLREQDIRYHIKVESKQEQKPNSASSFIQKQWQRVLEYMGMNKEEERVIRSYKVMQEGESWYSEGYEDGTIEIMQDDKCVASFLAHYRAIQNMAWSPNGDFLASTSADEVCLWDRNTIFLQSENVRTGEKPGSVYGSWSPIGTHFALVGGIGRKRDSRILYNALFIWELESGQLIRKIQFDKEINHFNWSSDGKALVTALAPASSFDDDEPEVCFYDIEGAKQYTIPMTRNFAPWQVAYSPDQEWIAVTNRFSEIAIFSDGQKIKKYRGDKTQWYHPFSNPLSFETLRAVVKMLTTPKGYPVRIAEHRIQVLHIEWSWDSAFVAVLSDDLDVYIFNVQQYHTVAKLSMGQGVKQYYMDKESEGFKAFASIYDYSLSWSKGERYLLEARYYHHVTVWDVKKEELVSVKEHPKDTDWVQSGQTYQVNTLNDSGSAQNIATIIRAQDQEKLAYINHYLSGRIYPNPRYDHIWAEEVDGQMLFFSLEG